MASGILNTTQLNIFNDIESYLPPSCVDLIDPQTYKQALPSFTYFGGISGGASLVGGGECAIAIAFVAERLYKAIETIGFVTPVIYQQLGVSPAELAKLYKQSLYYTDGYALVTTWSWPKSSVAKDYDSAGLCIEQFDLLPGKYASCWSVTKIKNRY